jgi:hypothetical protein
MYFKRCEKNSNARWIFCKQKDKIERQMIQKFFKRTGGYFG